MLWLPASIPPSKPRIGMRSMRPEKRPLRNTLRSTGPQRSCLPLGGEEALKGNAKYNDDALKFAKQSIADLEAGKTIPQ